MAAIAYFLLSTRSPNIITTRHCNGPKAHSMLSTKRANVSAPMCTNSAKRCTTLSNTLVEWYYKLNFIQSIPRGIDWQTNFHPVDRRFRHGNSEKYTSLAQTQFVPKLYQHQYVIIIYSPHASTAAAVFKRNHISKMHGCLYAGDSLLLLYLYLKE